MELTPLAQWLNSAFAGFDRAVSSFAYAMHSSVFGVVLDPFFKIVTHLGDAGILFIVLSIVLVVIKKTRRIGSAMLTALLVGFILNNIALKNIIARPRPYVNEMNGNEYFVWWAELGRHVDSEFSFPSGHAFVSFAAMTVLLLKTKGAKRYLWLIPAILIAFSRIYIYIHYPTDVIAGSLIGVMTAFLQIPIVAAVEKRLAARKIS